MDVQKDLLGWLEEATLFPSSTAPSAKQQQLHNVDQFSLCFSDLIDSNTDVQKTTGHDDNALLDLPDVSDILLENDWMDEKIDLSILDSTQEWLSPVIDVANVPSSDSDLQLESYVDYILSSPESVLNLQNDQETFQENHPGYFGHDYPVDASEVPTSSGSVNLSESGLQLPSSPSGSSCSGSSFVSGSEMSPPHYEQSSFDTVELGSPIAYCVEIVPDDPATVSPRSLEIEPTTSSISSFSSRKADGRGGGKDMSSVRSSLKSTVQSRMPYQQKKEYKRERKKVQNKEAAARYRMKKREQDRLLSDEVAVLEAEQAQLKEKHDKLKSEITYLKSLMRELFQARGILKQSQKKK